MLSSKKGVSRLPPKKGVLSLPEIPTEAQTSLMGDGYAHSRGVGHAKRRAGCTLLQGEEALLMGLGFQLADLGL